MQKADKNKFQLSKKILPDNFHIELDKTSRGISFSCGGVKGVTELSDSEVKLRLSEFSLLVCGKKLSITVFEGNSIEIIGKISEVKFIYGKS